MSLILELQAEALSEGSVSGLLRKVKAVASKLSIRQIQAWTEAEIEGYTTDPPQYRRFSSELKSLNPVTGSWMPTRIQGEKQARREWLELLTTIYIFNPMSEIETWLATDGGSIEIPLQNEENIPIDFGGLITKRFIPKTAIAVIPDRVRNQVLNWSLELEAKGILGEGMTFTAKEKAQATSVVTNNFYAPQYQNNGHVHAMGDAATVNTFMQKINKFFRWS